MAEPIAFAVRAFVIGVAATLALDLWTLALARLGVRPTDWGMVGRWIGHFRHARFTHPNIAAAAPVRGERLIGWTAHYAIGIIYAALLLAICGPAWARDPTLGPALAFGVVTVAAPFFILQPGMGAGVAASRTPNPGAVRAKSLMSHAIFGLGLYAGAELAAVTLPA